MKLDEVLKESERQNEIQRDSIKNQHQNIEKEVKNTSKVVETTLNSQWEEMESFNNKKYNAR